MKSTVLRRIYLFRAADDFMLIYPLYAVFFADNGLSNLQISLLFFIWGASSIGLEVPSGVLADKYDRRILLFIGEMLRAVGYMMWLIEPTFVGFLIGFVLWGAQGSLTSGTFEALTYDELKATRQEHRYTFVLGRCEACSLIAVLSSSALAALFARYGYDVLLVSSIAATIVAGLVALSLPKSEHVADVLDDRCLSILRRGVHQALRSRAVLVAIMLSAIAGTAYGALEEYDSLFARDIGLDNGGIALTVTGLALVAAVGASLAHRLEHVSRQMIAWLLTLSGMLLIIAATLQSLLGLIPFALYYLSTMLTSVIADARVQHAIADDTRATVTSVGAFATEVTSLIVFIAFGFLSRVSLFTAFQVFGVSLVIAGLVFAVLRARGSTETISVHT